MNRIPREGLDKRPSLKAPAQITLSLGLHLNAICRFFALRAVSQPKEKIKSLVPGPTKDNQLFS